MQAQSQLQTNGKYLWQIDPSTVDDECKLYADAKYPHRDSLDHPIKHSGRVFAAMVPATLLVPPAGIWGLYYSYRYWANYKFQRQGHHKNWTTYYEHCLQRKRVTLSFDSDE